MPAGMIHAAPLALPVVAMTAIASAAGCGSSSKGTCSCDDPTVYIDVPPDRAADVAAVVLSGQACATAVAQCVQPLGQGCARYSFQASTDGACDVDVSFASGPADFNDQLTFAQVSTCCPGYYAQPSGASPIEVPDLDGGTSG
jgi:hypothetical protein